ncbi:MAG TPA: hypothetical protein VGI30_10645 [Caulobacteraceae bacterium]
MAAFSFAYNPFVVLPVSLRASAREVEEAFQRRLAARPQDEAALTRARRLLLEPDSRLAAEVSWLIDVGPRDAVTLLGAMAGGNEAALLQALISQPPLSKANVAADACGRMKSTAFLRPLADAHRALDAAALTALLNDIHAAIPMAPVNPRLVEAALRAVTMLHAGAALEAISAQDDPAAAFAGATVGPDAADGALLDEIIAQYWRRYPLPAAAEEEAEPGLAPISAADAAPAPVAANEAFAEVHAVGEHSWGEGAAGAAAAASAFMDAQLIFSAHDRFDTYGNSRRVRRVMYIMGGALAAAVLLILVITRPSDKDDSDTNNAVDPPVNYAAAPPPPVANPHGRHKTECIHVSGATYCTSS